MIMGGHAHFGRKPMKTSTWLCHKFLSRFLEPLTGHAARGSWTHSLGDLAKDMVWTRVGEAQLGGLVHWMERPAAVMFGMSILLLSVVVDTGVQANTHTHTIIKYTSVGITYTHYLKFDVDQVMRDRWYCRWIHAAAILRGYESAMAVARSWRLSWCFFSIALFTTINHHYRTDPQWHNGW